MKFISLLTENPRVGGSNPPLGTTLLQLKQYVSVFLRINHGLKQLYTMVYRLHFPLLSNSLIYELYTEIGNRHGRHTQKR